MKESHHERHFSTGCSLGRLIFSSVSHREAIQPKIQRFGPQKCQDWAEIPGEVAIPRFLFERLAATPPVYPTVSSVSILIVGAQNRLNGYCTTNGRRQYSMCGACGSRVTRARIPCEAKALHSACFLRCADSVIYTLGRYSCSETDQ